MSAQDVLAEDLPCRVYEAGDPTVTVVYFHGGGFVVGGLVSHDDICAEICGQNGYRVLSVDYRLSPEHRHPAALTMPARPQDGPPRPLTRGLVLAGDSAGGTLAAAVAQQGRGQVPAIQGQVLIYPALGGDIDRGS